MDQYQDFIFFNYSRKTDQIFLKELHEEGWYWISIIDSVIYILNPNNVSDSYDIYTRSHEKNVFLYNEDGCEYIVVIWSDFTVFPLDWTASNAAEWWLENIVDWYKKIEFERDL